ncbi:MULTISPECIES: glycoside hydrolase family 26 protein [Rhizobium]|uniref:Glycosyl hydrolase family 5 n=1 Tax=Rhizobium leguminosarum TaxID=384 RepID=A0A7M3E268_RHILE|nr:glycosyl hydrolase [Rhizobium leguminosarum]MDV4161711.1 glycosyl hydrolase [Rhizobium leguminosarum]MDV4171513.1 glycosyl hydrolase [Rhizobium leguminosarum]NKK42251.1 glycosyl hydrolase family 5 [Rhizobium leguminosarum bv. viciae]TAY55039.1 glycosyl hydrolase family 5 [Rhizobium leguminosarum]TBE94605.1 glycosyl hydrolase family 5 [Rhizobium leguminosarum]
MKKLMKNNLSTTAIALLLLCLADLPGRSEVQYAGIAPNPAAAVQTIIDKRPVLHADGIKFGAYDPHGDFGAQANVATEALFLPWEDVDLETLRVADAYALARGRNLLITVEPWSWDVDWRLTSAQLRAKVLRGDYDVNMRSIAHMISELKSPVIVRWGQEMEDKSGRFSWSGWSPQDYITAYKRMMDIVRQEAPGTELMWSPKGEPGLQAYYPGDDYVDLIGLSVFGLQRYDELAHNEHRTFSEALKQGYDLVAGYGKPIWVAELGYEGGDAYIRPWIETATLKQNAFPNLQEVVYFNDRDVHAWPFDLGRPDWRVVENLDSN